MPTLTRSLDGIDRTVRVLGAVPEHELNRIGIDAVHRDRAWLRVYLEHEQRVAVVLAGRVEGWQ